MEEIVSYNVTVDGHVNILRVTEDGNWRCAVNVGNKAKLVELLGQDVADSIEATEWTQEKIDAFALSLI